jgi:hypothetical protein
VIYAASGTQRSLLGPRGASALMETALQLTHIRDHPTAGSETMYWQGQMI